MLPTGAQDANSSISRSTSPAKPVHAQTGRSAPDAGCRPPIRRRKELPLRGSENPNLMPKGAITVRMHSIGGWGAITTGKNLAMTLFELLGWDIKANPKYGSREEGPADHLLSLGRARADPRQLRIFYVDVVLSPDPAVFGHSNPLAGLKKGGVFIHPEQARRPADVWAAVPALGAAADRRQADCASSISTRSRSRAKKPAIPNCNCACRATPSRARSSPPRRSAPTRSCPRRRCSPPSNSSSNTSSATRARAWSEQHSRGAARL